VALLVVTLRYKPNRKFAGSIPNGVTGIFLWHNPSSHTKALVSTQPLIEMSTRNNSGCCKGGCCVRLTTFPPSLSRNLGASTFWHPTDLFRSVQGLLYHINITAYWDCGTIILTVCWLDDVASHRTVKISNIILGCFDPNRSVLRDCANISHAHLIRKAAGLGLLDFHGILWTGVNCGN